MPVGTTVALIGGAAALIAAGAKWWWGGGGSDSNTIPETPVNDARQEKQQEPHDPMGKQPDAELSPQKEPNPQKEPSHPQEPIPRKEQKHPKDQESKKRQQRPPKAGPINPKPKDCTNNKVGDTKKVLPGIAKIYMLDFNTGKTLTEQQLDVLLNTNQITTEELITIASRYHNGVDGAPVNLEQGLLFYQKASERGNGTASFYLGQFYQDSHENIPKSTQLSFFYYLNAVKQNHPDALIPLERVGEEVSAENQLKLSQLYGGFFHNREKADYWRSKAMEVEQFNLSM